MHKIRINMIIIFKRTDACPYIVYSAYSSHVEYVYI